MYPVTDNAKRVTKYRPHLNSIDLTGINFPTPVNQIGRFEENNPTISINIYVLGEKDDMEVIPKYVTKCGKREKHIELLLLTSETNDNSHYVWIKNMSALVCHRSKHKGAVYVCPHCVHPFRTEKAYLNHFDDCAKHKYQKTLFPEPDTDECKLIWRARARKPKGYRLLFMQILNLVWYQSKTNRT